MGSNCYATFAYSVIYPVTVSALNVGVHVGLLLEKYV